MKTWRWAILGGGLGLYLAGLGFLGGIVAERVRFDTQRTAVLHRYDQAVREWQAFLIRQEQQALEETTALANSSPMPRLLPRGSASR